MKLLFGMLFCILAIPFLIQLLTDVSGKAAQHGLGVWALCPGWETQKEFWVGGFGTLAIASIRSINQLLEDSVSHSLFYLYNSFQ